MFTADDLVEQMEVARRYTNTLVEDIKPDDWFREPQGGVTHLAWQVGHIAIAQFHLMLVRVRGKRPEDNEVIPEAYGSLFGRGSVPVPDASKYPKPDELVDVFHRVHEQCIAETKGLSQAILDEPVSTPHPMFTTKQEAVRWAAFHEILHAGQIGLLRRQFGYAILR